MTPTILAAWFPYGEGIASWWDYVNEDASAIWALAMEHVSLVLTALAVATAVSVTLGILAHRVKVFETPILGFTSTLLTIPSLALFVIFIPIVGIGRTPALIALTLYALLPIVRNTVTGLKAVDPAVRESARGMGMSKTQILLKIELPLAWPVIATGIRVAMLLAVGIAAIATLVGAGGLGDLIKEGLPDRVFPGGVEKIWAGTIFTIVVGLVLDLLFGLLRYATTPKAIGAIARAGRTVVGAVTGGGTDRHDDEPGTDGATADAQDAGPAPSTHETTPEDQPKPTRSTR